MPAFASCNDIKTYDVTSEDASVTIVKTTTGNNIVFDLSVPAGGGSSVAVSDIVAGHKTSKLTIGTVDFVLNETVTSIGQPTYDSVTGDLTFTYVDENGTSNEKTVQVAPVFVNTDGQQLTGDTTGTVNLTLTAVPNGDQTDWTVKADLPLATSTPSGLKNALKFDSSLGGWYVEGSEAAALRMSIPPGAQQAVGAGSGIRVIVDVTTASASGNTTLLTPDLANNCVKLKEGFTYEFDADISLELGAANNTMSFQFVTSEVGPTGPWTNRQLVGTFSTPQASTLNVWSNKPKGVWAPVVPTWLALACINSVGAGNNINLPTGTGSTTNTGIAWTVKKVGSL